MAWGRLNVSNPRLWLVALLGLVFLALVSVCSGRTDASGEVSFVEVDYEEMYWSLYQEYPEAKWHRATQQVYQVPADLGYWQDYYASHVLPYIDLPSYGRHGEGYTSPILTLRAMSDARWENPRLPIGRVDGLVHTKYRWGYHSWNIVAVAPEGVCCIWYIMDTESPRASACYYFDGDNKPCTWLPLERGIFKKPAGWTAIGNVEL